MANDLKDSLLIGTLSDVVGDLADLLQKELRLAKAELSEKEIKQLEMTIDTYEKELPELRNFIAQGGSLPGAHLHLARTICRRVERAVVELKKHEAVTATSLQYLNRLSDLLFVLARAVNRRVDCEEQPLKWPPESQK